MVRKAFAIVATVFAAALVSVPVAIAAAVPLGAGETKLVLPAGLEKTLRREGVVVKPLGPAKLKGRRLALPVSSGTFDPAAVRASIISAGGFRLAVGRRAATVRRLRLDSSTQSLSAIIGGRRLLLAQFAGGKLEREGFDAHLVAERLRTTGAAAAALNRALGLPRLFRVGRSLGSLDGLAEPSEVEVSGSIAIGGPETVFERLRSLKVEMGLWGGSEGWNTGVEEFFIFPMVQARIPIDASTGVVEGGENDGVTMQIFESPPREMLLRHPRIDLATREVSATLSPLSTEGAITGTIGTLDLSAAKVQFRAKVGAFELTGARVISNQFIADQLNTRFETPGTFQPGETLAKLSVIMYAHSG